MLALPNRLLTTRDGVFQPPAPLWLHGALFTALVVGVVAFAVFSTRGVPFVVSVPLAFAAVAFIQSVLEYRRYGPQGRPLVLVSPDSLSLNPRMGSPFNVQLSTIKAIVIYGQAGRRTYRAVSQTGAYTEAKPLWGPKEDHAVIAFLQAALGERVVVEEPQTAFAAARGDGPYYDA